MVAHIVSNICVTEKTAPAAPAAAPGTSEKCWLKEAMETMNALAVFHKGISRKGSLEKNPLLK